MLKFEKWIPLQESDIQTYLAAPQLERLRTWGTDPHAHDPLPKIIQDVTASLRGVAALFAPLPLDTHTIPSQWLLYAVFLVIEALHSRLPTLNLSENQIRRIQHAHAHMDTLFQLYEKQTQLFQKSRNHPQKFDYFYGRARPKRVSSKTLYPF